MVYYFITAIFSIRICFWKKKIKTKLKYRLHSAHARLRNILGKNLQKMSITIYQFLVFLFIVLYIVLSSFSFSHFVEIIVAVL